MTDSTLLTQVVCRLTLPLVGLATHSSFWRMHQEMYRRHALDGSSPSTTETLERLRALMIHASQTVPLYRQRFEAMKPEDIRTLEDFRRLPTLSKQELAANFPDRAVSSRKVFPPWRYAATSGTIDRMTVVHDMRKRDYARGTQLLALRATSAFRPGMKYMEIPPDACANICGIAGMADDPPLARYVWQALRTRTLFSPEVMSNVRGLFERQVVYRRVELQSFSRDGLVQRDSVLDEYLAQIDEYRPHVVKALPAYLYILSLRLEQTGARPPRIGGALMPMGSSISSFVKRAVERAFQVPVHEDYGSAELTGIASECGRQAGLHPFEDAVYVEVVTHGRPAQPGEVGRVLVTDLWNYAMPLIRYEIGDVAVVTNGRCECGRTGIRLDVQGRLQDCLVSADGRILTTDVVTDAILEGAGVIGFQADQRQDGTIHLQVIPRDDGYDGVKRAAAVLRALLGDDRPIVTRNVSTILPERSGKYRFVRNATNGPTAALGGEEMTAC